MNHLEELLNKFSDIPRSVVLKTDLLRLGVKHTPILKEIGTWSRPQTHSVYEFDHEDVHTKDDTTEGWVNIPCEFRFSDGTSTMLIVDTKSPYEIRGEDGKHMLYLGENPIEEVIFCPRPTWYMKKTSHGTLMSTVGYQVGDCITVICVNHCEYFNTDDACGFCCLNPTTDRSRELGIDRTIARTVDDFVETYAEASKETCHITLSGGGLIDRKKEAGRHIRMLTALRDAGYRPDELMTVVQALEEEDTRRLYDLGVATCIAFDMEVWQGDMWPIIVPGKSKFVGRDRWINCLIKAVEIFGRGNVMTNFVAGCEMVPPHGFKDVDEAVNSTLDGFEWLVQRGITPHFTCWSNNPGSKLANVELPPTEYYLKLGIGHHKLLIKYDLSLPKARCHDCSSNAPGYDFQRLVAEPTRTATVAY